VAVWAIAAGVVVAAATAFWFRTRLAAPVGIALMVASSALIAWGVTALQPAPSAGEAAFAVALLAVLGPAHVRVVLGPYGRPS
jgi:hypothetical protein